MSGNVCFFQGGDYLLRCVVTGNKFNSLVISRYGEHGKKDKPDCRLQLPFQPQISLISWSLLVLNHYWLKSNSILLPIALLLGATYAKSVVCVHAKFHVVLSTWQDTFSSEGFLVGFFFHYLKPFSVLMGYTAICVYFLGFKWFVSAITFSAN